jgi:hypothetical protein
VEAQYSAPTSFVAGWFLKKMVPCTYLPIFAAGIFQNSTHLGGKNG